MARRRVLNRVLAQEIARTTRSENVYRWKVEPSKPSRGHWVLFWLAIALLAAVTVRQIILSGG